MGEEDFLSGVGARWQERQGQLVERCIEIQQIPGPTGDEARRADYVAQAFRKLGLEDVAVDEVWNVYGRVRGAKAGPGLLVSAHTDTVFGPEVDLSVRVDAENDRLWGPGIGDNSTGVAALLALAETLTQDLAGQPPAVDIWLVANSCEEGLGDLRGMRMAVDRLEGSVGACVVIEGMGLGRIVHRGLGSRRYRIETYAPGGHSWSDFGTASAIHVLMQLGNDICRLHVPLSPRTTFNLGKISGGTSVNTIAQTASAELDLRSESVAALEDIIAQVEGIVARYTTPKRRRQGIEVRLETIGDRPAGEIDTDHPLVAIAAESLNHCLPPRLPEFRISSTDANIPLSRGIPAVCIGITDGGDAHRVEEWIHSAPLAQGVEHLIRLTWRAAAWLAQTQAPGEPGGRSS